MNVMLAIDKNVVDHIILLIEDTQDIIVERGLCYRGNTLWIHEEEKNTLRRGRHLICLCNVEDAPLREDMTWTDIICLRLEYEERAYKKLISPRTLPDQEDPERLGCLVMIKKKYDVSDLRYLCHEHLEEDDFMTDMEGPLLEDIFITGKKFMMTYMKRKIVTPTCICNRWEAPMPLQLSDRDNRVKMQDDAATAPQQDSDNESNLSTHYSPTSPLSTLSYSSYSSYSSKDEEENKENIDPQA